MSETTPKKYRIVATSPLGYGRIVLQQRVYKYKNSRYVFRRLLRAGPDVVVTSAGEAALILMDYADEWPGYPRFPNLTAQAYLDTVALEEIIE